MQLVLSAQDNNLERAADWVFSHAGDLDAMETDQPPSAGEGEGTATNCHDGPGSKQMLPCQAVERQLTIFIQYSVVACKKY